MISYRFVPISSQKGVIFFETPGTDSSSSDQRHRDLRTVENKDIKADFHFSNTLIWLISSLNSQMSSEKIRLF